MGFELRLGIEDGDRPVFLRIAEAVVREIRRGRLREGDPLPGTRRLATQLGVHRNTVIAAWGELRSQGWIETRARGTTRVAPLPSPPEVRPEGLAQRRSPRQPGFALAPEGLPEARLEPRPGMLILAGGRPDLRLLPVNEIARAWQAAVRNSRGRILDYGDPQGHPEARRALAAMLGAERGLVVDPDELVVTRGSQQALYLLARVLLRTGDRVAVERLGYPPAWAALRETGAELVPIDVDRDGLRVDQVEDAARAGPLRAVYCTPHHQFPTLVTLSPDRRQALLDLARRHRVAILEDDYDAEYHYAGRPVMPLAAHDPDGTVLYVGTMSKTLAPGLRLGFLCAPRPVVDAVLARRIAVDRQGDTATELAIAELVADGTIDRHLRRMRRIYAARQTALAAGLRETFGDRLVFRVPDGGLALWVRADTDVGAWQARAWQAGLGFDIARRYHVDGTGLPYFRAGFASLDEGELARAVKILAATCPAVYSTASHPSGS